MMRWQKVTLIGGLVAVSVVAGWWLADRANFHQHIWVKVDSEQGKGYWTCAMHPQVRQDRPGNCPICGMKLVRSEPEPKNDKKAGERRVLYWYDPMKPEVHFDAPGKSPFMDMQLVPKYADNDADGAIRIDPHMIQNLGVRTALVERGELGQRVAAVGEVMLDEHAIVSVEARVAGWIERLDVRAVGDAVRAGQPIAGIYAPELLAAQEELLLARRTDDATLLTAARQRLSLLGMSDAQIDQVLADGAARRRVNVIAPSSGVVTQLNLREGGQVTPGTAILQLADLSKVWVVIEIPETEGAVVNVGQTVEVRLPALPGRSFMGSVDYVYPQLQTSTRTQRARLILENPDWLLRPGMFADTVLLGEPRSETLLVPSEAVIRTGERTVVILSEGEGRFRPAHVELGAEREGWTEILAGLKEGELVVVSGQFLLDSEANLRSVLGRLTVPHAELQPMQREGTLRYRSRPDAAVQPLPDEHQHPSAAMPPSNEESAP